MQRNPEMSSTKSFVGIQLHPNWLNACHLRFASRGGLSYNVPPQKKRLHNIWMVPQYLSCASPKQQAEKLIATMTLKDFAPCQTVSLQSTVNKVRLIVEFQAKKQSLII